MGKLIQSLNVSLDGFVETPDHGLDLGRRRSCGRWSRTSRSPRDRAGLSTLRLYNTHTHGPKPSVVRRSYDLDIRGLRGVEYSPATPYTH